MSIKSDVKGRLRKESDAGSRSCRRVSLHVKILWSTLSVMVTAGCTFSFTQPYWFVQPDTRDCLGLFNYCIRDPRASRTSSVNGHHHSGGGSRVEGFAAYAAAWSTAPLHPQMCGVYGGEFHLSNLPSNAWQIACVLYGGGCVLLGLGSIAAFFTFCLPTVWSSRLASYTGYIQTMAGASYD